MRHERLTLIDAHGGPRVDLAQDVRQGLLALPKHLSCAFLYDARGSRLFEEICGLPEYYLTRAEREILARRASEIVTALPAGAALVELGSGSAVKTRLLIEALLARAPRLRYLPIDIASEMLAESAAALLADYRPLEITAIAADYETGLARLDGAWPAMLLVWLGSSIGNLDRHEAVALLARVRRIMRPADRLLLGVDLRKPRAILERAYADARGVTARFNLNLLARINRELGGRFDLDAFTHRAVYDAHRGRVEMRLVSARRQRVPITRLGITPEFAAGEWIHTESSYKYSLAEIDALALRAGFTVERRWCDHRRQFSENLLAPLATNGGRRG